MRRLVGRNFARLRRQKGFTQESHAEAAGVTQQYVSDLERGLRNPTVVTLYHLASALGVSHVELVTPDDEARREAAKASGPILKAQVRKGVKRVRPPGAAWRGEAAWTNGGRLGHRDPPPSRSERGLAV